MPHATDPAADIGLTDQEARFYQAEGYLVIPGLIRPECVTPLREAVFETMEKDGIARESLRKATGSGDKLRQCGSFDEGSLLEAFIYSPRIRAIAERLMGGPSTTYLPFTAVKSGGGGGEFHFHQDNQYTRHDGPSCNIWVALVPMSPENGCLCVVPRSNHGGTLESRLSGDGDTHRRTLEDPKEYLPLRMNAGDAVAFTRLTVHGSGPNHTSEPRIAYALQYHRDDTKYLHPDGTWKLLKTEPRWQVKPRGRK